MRLLEFEDERGRCPFRAWFRSLDAAAAAKVNTALTRLELGNTSNVKGVGEGVLELKMDFGPGYRVYFGMDGADAVILLCGGTKTRQSRDIDVARTYWRSYKRRKNAKGWH